MAGNLPVTRVWQGGAWRTDYREVSSTDPQLIVDDVFRAPLRSDGASFPADVGLGTHAAALRGVPASYDWAAGASKGVWDFNTLVGANTYTHMQPWLQIFEDAAGNPERRARVEIERPRIFYAGADFVWSEATRFSAGGLGGGYWRPSPFTAVQNFGASTLKTLFGGTASAALAPINDDAKPLIHAWWTGYFPRLPITAGTLYMHVSTRMRLVATEDAVDLSRCRYLAACSGDLYTAVNETVAPNGINPAIGVPAHRYLTSRWQHFGYTSGMDQATLAANLPPTAGEVFLF